MKNSETAIKSRAWTFVVYPGESAPENWRSIIDDFHLRWLESPLHSLDTNADGSEKKPHVHVMVVFDSPRSLAQMKEITSPLNCPAPQVVRDTRAMARYFIHLDNPEKHQYARQDLIPHGGLDLDELLLRSSSDYVKISKEILTYCRENNICEYGTICDECQAHGFDDWYDCLFHNTMFFKGYFASQRHKVTYHFDQETGEVK